MSKQFRSYILLTALPAFIAAVLFGACYVCQNEYGDSHIAADILNKTGFASIAALVLTIIIAVILSDRFKGSEKAADLFWGVIYGEISAILVSFISFAVADVGTLFDAVMIFLILYGNVLFWLTVAFVINRGRHAKAGHAVKVKKAYTEKHQEWLRERYGSNEQLEDVLIVNRSSSFDIGELVYLLCGVKLSELIPDNSGDEYDCDEIQARLEDRGLLLNGSVYAARHPDLLRIIFARLCANRGINAHISEKELADELKRCDNEYIRNRRREGISTFEHDVNCIGRILERQGYSIVYIDAEPFDDCFAVVRIENANRLLQLSDSADSESLLPEL